MPLVFWATQTVAASSLLRAGEIGTTLLPYLSPTSAASIIQNAYHIYALRRSRRILPSPRGPYKSRPGSHIFTEEWAIEMNASYQSQLAEMYRRWSTCPLSALVTYLNSLRSQDIEQLPRHSTDFNTYLRESLHGILLGMHY